MSALPAPDFCLESTLTCGQVFHWQRRGSGFLGLIGDEPLYVEQSGETLLVSADMEVAAHRYFALDLPLADICATFPRDEAMTRASEFCSGLRLVRQPLWECVATFLTSSMKQVAHIAQMSHALRSRFGAARLWNGEKLHAYPTPEAIAGASEDSLRECKLGYRAKNLLRSAELIASGAVNLEQIRQMPDEEALAELCRLPGVGVKVANCALLFAYERLAAFPIDVWIERVLRELYFSPRAKPTAARLKAFSRKHFGPYGGYAQQYLFHHARMTWKRERALR